MEENKNNGNGCIIAFAAILGIIMIIPLMISLINSKKSLEEEKLQLKLVKEGKIVYAQEVTEKFANSLKNKNYNEISKYISDNCKFYNNDGQQRSLEQCMKELEEYSNHRIEARGDTNRDDIKTYRIYWNGTNYENTKQIIMLQMNRKVKKDEIIYEITDVKFTDNTPSY